MMRLRKYFLISNSLFILRKSQIQLEDFGFSSGTARRTGMDSGLSASRSAAPPISHFHWKLGRRGSVGEPKSPRGARTLDQSKRISRAALSMEMESGSESEGRTAQTGIYPGSPNGPRGQIQSPKTVGKKFYRLPSRKIRNCQKGLPRGFTLLEMLIAVTLFAMVSSASYGIFRMGMEVWRRTQGRSVIERKALFAMEKMTRDLRSSIRTEEKKEGLGSKNFRGSGDRKKISIPSLIEVKSGDIDMFQYGLIQYEWNSSKHEICRREKSASDIYSDREPPCQGVAQAVKSFKLRYLLYDGVGDNYSWYDQWDRDDEFAPAAVEIQVEMEPMLKGEKHPVKRTFEKVVTIPVGGKFEKEKDAAGQQV